MPKSRPNLTSRVLRSLSAPKTLIHSARLFDGETTVENGWLLFDETVLASGTGEDWQQQTAIRIIDAKGALISPGLIDSHTHGANGFAVEDGAEAMRQILDFEEQHGSRSVILSLVSNSIDELCHSLVQANAVAKFDNRLLGIHLEGPFLSHSHKGAHNPEILQVPTVDAVARLLSSGNGLVRSITLAPELTSEHIVKMLLEAGVKICVGHTDADYQVASQAFADGATVLTHAFNGMRSIHHREPGPVLAAIDSPNVWLELIADGVHVAPTVARLLPSDKLILVTDAMAAAGKGDGNYSLGALEVDVVAGVARVKTGSIAGSTLTIDAAVRNYAEWSGSLDSALRAATSNVAKAYGLVGFGSLALGAKADVLIWDSQLSPKFL